MKSRIPAGNQFSQFGRIHFLGDCKIEEIGYLILPSQLRVDLLFPQLIKERMHEGLAWGNSSVGRVPHHFVQKVIKLFTVILLLQNLNKCIFTFSHGLALILGNWYF
jgi:hypothetical protein